MTDLPTTAYHRGHPYYWSGELDDPEVYVDDGTDVVLRERPCTLCGLVADGYGAPDSCLGRIDGVRNACCGHGVWHPYVQFWLTKMSHRTLSDDDALVWFAEHGVGPWADTLDGADE